MSNNECEWLNTCVTLIASFMFTFSIPVNEKMVKTACYPNIFFNILENCFNFHVYYKQNAIFKKSESCDILYAASLCVSMSTFHQFYLT